MKDTLQRLADMAERITSSEAVRKDAFGFTMDIPDMPLSFFAANGDTNEAYCRALVGKTEGACPAGFAEAALMGNFFWRATEGATLSLDEKENAIYLTDRFDEGAFEEEAAFTDYVNELLRTVQDWRSRLESYLMGKEASK